MNITGLHRRIKNLERWLASSPAEPIKSVVPEWLAAEWRAQGIAVSSDGRPALRSLTEELRQP